ncbi:MAG: VWA domain-containing protein [Dehalococcoidia bacterium]|nr:VWA domain-containing protein [Dehalococcoidia bacterium]
MSFASPLWLLALLAVPLLIWIYLAVQRRRTQYAVRFTNLDLLANVVSEQPRWRRHVPPALFLAGLAILALAIARPQADVEVPKEEATVILVFDVSGSMNATDVEPTRLRAAQDAAHTFLDRIPEGFRVGIVSFAETARVVLPPTDDRDQAHMAVDTLRAVGGTAMGDALMLALDLLRNPVDFGAEPTPGAGEDGNGATPEADGTGASDEDPPGVVLMLGDGFNTVGQADPIDAARDAADMNVPVFTVALGTPDGVVDVFDNQGRLRRVRVPPDEATLERIAELTEAESYTALDEDQLNSVYEGLSSRVGFETEQQEVTWVFAVIAGMFLLGGVGASLYWFNRFP